MIDTLLLRLASGGRIGKESVLTLQEPLTNGRLTPKRALFKLHATQTLAIHSCGAERALNLSEAVFFSARLPPGGTPLIKPTDCTLYRRELPQTGLHCKRRPCVCLSVCVSVCEEERARLSDK